MRAQPDQNSPGLSRHSLLRDLLRTDLQATPLPKMWQVRPVEKGSARRYLPPMRTQKTMRQVRENQLCHRQNHALRPRVQCLLAILQSERAVRGLRESVWPFEPCQPSWARQPAPMSAMREVRSRNVLSMPTTPAFGRVSRWQAAMSPMPGTR